MQKVMNRDELTEIQPSHIHLRDFHTNEPNKESKIFRPTNSDGQENARGRIG